MPPQLQEIRQRFPNHTPRVRVTTDLITYQIKAQIVKLRVADLHIYCPRNNFDVRISVAAEVKYPHAVTGLREHQENNSSQGRKKDRLSYKHQDISIDLTQVTQDQGEKLHELELEIDTNLLAEQARLAIEGQPNDYEELVGIFLNYVKVLNRACGD
jgi:polynucleotide 5'-triphosphatase